MITSTNPVHNSQVHPHREHTSGEVNSLGDVAEQLMVEALDPISVTTLLTLLINSEARN